MARPGPVHNLPGCHWTDPAEMVHTGGLPGDLQLLHHLEPKRWCHGTFVRLLRLEVPGTRQVAPREHRREQRRARADAGGTRDRRRAARGTNAVRGPRGAPSHRRLQPGPDDTPAQPPPPRSRATYIVSRRTPRGNQPGGNHTATRASRRRTRRPRLRRTATRRRAGMHERERGPAPGSDGSG